MQHLLDRAAHGVGDLAPDVVVGLGQPRVQPGQLGVDHLVGAGPQRGHGRRDGQLLLLGAGSAPSSSATIAVAAATSSSLTTAPPARSASRST